MDIHANFTLERKSGRAWPGWVFFEYSHSLFISIFLINTGVEFCSYKAHVVMKLTPVIWHNNNKLWLTMCSLWSVQLWHFSDRSAQIFCITLFKNILIHRPFCFAQNIKEMDSYIAQCTGYTDLLLLGILFCQICCRTTSNKGVGWIWNYFVCYAGRAVCSAPQDSMSQGSSLKMSYLESVGKRDVLRIVGF